MKPALPAAFMGAAILTASALLADDFGSWFGGSNPMPGVPRIVAGAPATPKPERSPGPEQAASLQTVNLKVENMWCASCPIIVRRALQQIDGVGKVQVSFRSKTATVAFDPSRCDADKLTAATAAHGFPSRVIR